MTNIAPDKQSRLRPYQILPLLTVIPLTFALYYFQEDSWLLRIAFAGVLLCACPPVLLAATASVVAVALPQTAWSIDYPEIVPFLLLTAAILFQSRQRQRWGYLPESLASSIKSLLLGTTTALLFASLFRPYTWWLMLVWALLLLLLLRGSAPPVRKLLSRSNLQLLAGCLIFSLVVLEIGGRILVPWHGMYAFCDPDPEYLFKLRRNIEVQTGFYRYSERKTVIEIKTSSQGLRDRSYGPKQPAEIRIAMVGDSYTFGWGVTLKESIPKQLESILARRFPDRQISVIVCGLGGYAPWQELAMFRERVLPLEPDLVLFQSFVMNDIAESLLQEGRVLRAYSGSNIYLLRARQVNEYPVGKIDLWLARHSGLYRAIKETLRFHFLVTRLYNECRLTPAIPLAPFPPNASRPWWMEVNLAAWYPELEDGWALFQRDVLRMRDVCADASLPFLAFNVPYPYMQEELEGALAGQPPGTYEPDKAIRLVREFYTHSGIPQCDLLDAVRACPDAARLYFPVDGHFTPAGNILIADLLADFVGGHLPALTNRPSVSAN